MKLNFLLLSFTFLLLSSFSNVSPQNVDPRIIDFLGQKKVDVLLKNNPGIIEYYQYYLDNAYYISELDGGKMNSKNISGTIHLKSLKKSEINILKLDIQRAYDHPVYYKISNSNKLMVFISEKEFMRKFNSYKTQKHE